MILSLHMKPPFEISSKMLNLCVEISQIIGRLEAHQMSPPKPILMRKNRIKTVQASLAIEGNALTEEQVTAILEHKRVLGPEKEILEVQNAFQAYEMIPQYRVIQTASLLKAHKTLMKNLIPDAGKFRNSSVGVMQGARVVHIAPKANRVPQLMDDLFQFLKEDKETHPLIKSSIFHYEFEFIHPFSDGNGRMGRLWQTTLLYNFHSMFEFIPIESVIKQKQQAYYKALEVSDKEGNSNSFLEFMLETILQTCQKFFVEYQPQPETQETRILNAKKKLGKKLFTRKDYTALYKSLSTATASRDLQFGVKQKILKKSGNQATTRYRFI